VGMVVTPLLVLWLMGAHGAGGASAITDILLHLLLPFVIGQLLQPWAGRWVRAHRPLTKILDQGTVVVLVLSAVATATAQGVWQQVSSTMVVTLIAVSAAVLAAILVVTWQGGRMLRLTRADRIAL